MVKLNMLSRNFSHDKGSTANKAPQLIEWCFNSYDNPISVYFSDLLDDICVSNSKCIVYTSNPCPYGF